MKNKNHLLIIDKPRSAIVASKNFRHQRDKLYLILYLNKKKKLIFQKQLLEKDIYKPVFSLTKPKGETSFIIILYNNYQLKLRKHSINNLLATGILLGVRLLDVIFISRNEYSSLHESGKIS